MLIFGGEDFQRQILQVQSCELKSIGELAFDHDGGACEVFDDEIYLCFSYNGDERLCRKTSSPLGQFSDVPRAIYEHELTGMAASECKNSISKN